LFLKDKLTEFGITVERLTRTNGSVLLLLFPFWKGPFIRTVTLALFAKYFSFMLLLRTSSTKHIKGYLILAQLLSYMEYSWLARN
jgi:hypothetical protein